MQKSGENSIDAIIDLVAGAQWLDLLNMLKPCGRYAGAGATVEPRVEVDVRILYNSFK